MIVSQRIKTIRRKLDMKQSYVAYKMGVSQQFYSSIERGKRDSTFVTITRVASIFEIDPLFILSPEIPITDETITIFKKKKVSDMIISYFENNSQLFKVAI